jgi:hypothetical protein
LKKPKSKKTCISKSEKEIHQSHSRKNVFIFQKVIVLSFLSLSLKKNCNTKKGSFIFSVGTLRFIMQEALGKGFWGVYNSRHTYTRR